MLGWDVRAIQRSQPLSWLFCGHTQSWCCSLYSQARTAALELAVAGGHCSGRPPWSSVWRPGILAETGCVNKNHSSYSLSLCCVTGQIRNVFGLKFKLSTWSSMWKDEPASWERGLSFAWMQAGTWKAGHLSLGVKNIVKIKKKKKKKTFLKGRAQGEASFSGLGRRLQRQANAQKDVCPENSLVHHMLAFLPSARGKTLGVRNDMREIRGLFL